MSGQEDGNHETGDKLEGSKAKRKGDHLLLEEDHSAELNNVKAAAAIAWQISPLGQQHHAIVVATKKVHPGGKNGKGRDCHAEQLVKNWWQWCHTST